MNSTMLPIPLALVRVVDRLREVNQAKVAELAVSMKEIGQLAAIEVARIHGGGEYRLIAGAHRLAAAEAAGITDILAVIFEGSPDEERLREIDENLYRAELGPLDQASFLAERRDIWERLHGKIARGGDRRSKGQNVPLIEQPRQLSFFDDVTKQFGLHRKVVQRALKRRFNIQRDLWDRLKASPFAYKAAELDAIGRMHMAPDQQRAVVDLLLAGPGAPKTVKAALLQIVGPPPVDDRKDDGLPAIRKAWAAATTSGQGRAIEWLVKKHPWIVNAVAARARSEREKKQ
jgi:ParB family chromosome partitioning protein